MFDGLSGRNNFRHADCDFAVVDDFLGLAFRSYRGGLFCSNLRGNNEEGLRGDRCTCFLDHITRRDYIAAAGLLQVRHYYRPPGLPRHKQCFLATVSRKGKVRHTWRAKRVWRRRLRCGCLENGSPKRVWRFELRWRRQILRKGAGAKG